MSYGQLSLLHLYRWGGESALAELLLGCYLKISFYFFFLFYCDYIKVISGSRNWADSSHITVWKSFALLRSSERSISIANWENSDNSVFLCVYNHHRCSYCELYGAELWPRWQPFPPPPVLSLADAGHALRLRGAVQEDSWPCVRAAGHKQQLRVKEAKAIQRQHSEHPEAASLDESTLDFCCSSTSSDTPCTLHDRIPSTVDVVWVEGGASGETAIY